MIHDSGRHRPAEPRPAPAVGTESVCPVLKLALPSAVADYARLARIGLAIFVIGADRQRPSKLDPVVSNTRARLGYVGARTRELADTKRKGCRLSREPTRLCWEANRPLRVAVVQYSSVHIAGYSRGNGSRYSEVTYFK